MIAMHTQPFGVWMHTAGPSALRVSPLTRQVGHGVENSLAGLALAFQLTEENPMIKLLSTLVVVAGTLVGFTAQAASHVGAAPMKPGESASAPAPAASAAKKKKTKKHVAGKQAQAQAAKP